MQTYLQFSWLMFDLLVGGFSLSFVAGRHQIYLANFQGKLVEKQNLRCCCDLLKKKSMYLHWLHLREEWTSGIGQIRCQMRRIHEVKGTPTGDIY